MVHEINPISSQEDVKLGNGPSIMTMAPKPSSKGRKSAKSPHSHPKSLKRKRDEDDHATLDQRIADLDPTTTQPEKFSDLPLSSLTSSGLDASHFKALTEIQSKAIPHALKGSDILGAAKTGSGKTLAFIVPVLENLYRKQWTEYDGLGALILSPTRELAIQIFEVLRKVGRHHTFSAGLVIGGKSLQEERERLNRMNILVCTPGRMLQHMDQTAAFEIDNLQMLVLDEADRILDMGFQATIDAIVDHLPKERQTILFSATQTRKISDLARLSLQDPEYVSVHESAVAATPTTLQQNYIVTPLPEKLDTLWSFIRANLKSKILVFLSSGKQVRFVYEAFRHLQPGMPISHLHGRQKQTARLDITNKFSSAQHHCLFATDVAARGLDFPAVDWVIQLDCPEDADTYIHRVGRTARYEREGKAVLFLLPTEEEGMLARLKQKKVPVEKINVRAKKQTSIVNQLQNMCFKDPELKYLGQKAFISYVRSIHVQKDKEIFRVQELPLEEFAASLGLPGAPRVKFVKGEDAKIRKNAPRQLLYLENSDSEGNGKAEEEKPAVRTRYDRMFERRNQDVLADHYAKMIDDKDEVSGNIQSLEDAASDDDFLAVRRRFDAGDENLGEEESSEADDSASEGDETDAQDTLRPNPDHNNSKPIKKVIHLSSTNNPSENPLIIDSKRREKLLKSKKKLLQFKGKGSHLHFGSDDDTPHEATYYEREEDFKKKGEAEEQRRAFLESETHKKEEVDMIDKEAARAKKREKREKRKQRERGDEDERTAVLEPDGDGVVGRNLDELSLSEEEAERPAKKTKKWFQRDEAEEDAIEQRRVNEPPETLEDLESVAQGLLARR